MWLEPQLANLPAKDRQLVAEDENLQLLRALTSAKKHDQLQQAAEDDLQGEHKQRQPPADGNADANAASPAVVAHPIRFLHPTPNELSVTISSTA